MAGKYILAVRREQRESAPADWLDRVRATEGVHLLESRAGRAWVEADDAGLRRLESALGQFCHIEPVIEHFPS